jgi:hypothetical protein
MWGIDVCLVAGRRPDLLRTTLASFQGNLFSKIRINKFIANIDPVFGSDDDAHECRKLIEDLGYDSSVTISETAGFCRAVASNWSKTSSELIFHMEDDWVIADSFDISALAPFETDPKIAQMAFNTKEKNWSVALRGKEHTTRAVYRLFGVKLPASRRIASFTTSPSFLRGDFARQCASLMDFKLDPEKQFTNRTNMKLFRYSRNYRVLLLGDGPNYPISDIGRQWRDERGIRKSLVNGASTWSDMSCNQA